MIDAAAITSLRATEIPGHWIAEVRMPGGRVVFASGLRPSYAEAEAAAEHFRATARRNGSLPKGAVYR